MTSVTQSSVSAEKTRAIVLPTIAALILFAAILVLQFSSLLGQYNFIAQFPLAVGFYYCWAWHTRLAKRAARHEAELKR